MPHVALKRPAVATARMLWACQAVTATQLKATSPANGAEKPSLRVPARTCSFAQLPMFDTEPGPYFRIQAAAASSLASGVWGVANEHLAGVNKWDSNGASFGFHYLSSQERATPPTLSGGEGGDLSHLDFLKELGRAIKLDKDEAKATWNLSVPLRHVRCK